MPERTTERARPLRVALLLGIAFMLLYSAISRGVFLYGDDILMYQVTEAIVERDDVAVTSPHDRGDVARAIPGDDGRGYAKYGIGQSLIAIPAYVASYWLLEPFLPIQVFSDDFGNQRMGPRIFGTGLTNAALGGATVGLLFLLALAIGYRQATALVLALLLGTGTLLAHYAATFLSEPLSALCLTAMVLGLVRAQLELSASQDNNTAPRRATRWLIVAGCFAGLALATRLALGLTLIAPVVWLCWTVLSAWRARRIGPRRALGLLAAWGLPIAGWLAGVAYYNWLRFADPLETGYGSEWDQMTAPFMEGLYGLLLSPGRGVLWYNPVLLLALVGLPLFLLRRPGLGFTLMGMFAGTLLLYASYYAWEGGGVWGPRFLVPLLPLLLLPAGEVVELCWAATSRHARAIIGGTVVVVALAGVYVTALGVVVPFDRYVAEYTASPERREAANFEWSSSPLVVHARRLPDTLGAPDIASVRYDSSRLLAFSWLTLALGSLLVLRAILLVACPQGVLPARLRRGVIRAHPAPRDYDELRC